jgi:hypothetical protein
MGWVTVIVPDQTSKQIADLSISTQNLPVAVHWQKWVDETSLHLGLVSKVPASITAG